MEKSITADASAGFLETLMMIHNNFYRQTQIPVPLNQFGVLCALRAEKIASISDISHTLNISKQQMTIVIDKLVKNDLVQKTIDYNDRRRFLVSLTVKGQAVLAKQDDVVKEKFRQQSEYLTASERQQLSQIITNFNHLLEKMFI